MDSSIVRCQEKVDYGRRLTDFLAWMPDQKDFLSDKPNLEYFMVSPQFDWLWVVDRHKY